MLKINGLELFEGRKYYQQEKKNICLNKIIHFSMLFSAVLNIFIVKT